MCFSLSYQLVGLPRPASSALLLSQHLSLLGLKWRSDIDASEDFKGYLSLNAAGTLLATGASTCYVDSRLDIWNTETLQRLHAHETDSSSSACLAWLSDDRYITGSNDSLIRLWREGSCEAVLAGHTDWVRSLAISSDDSLLFSGGMNSEIALWDLHALTRVAAFRVPGRENLNSIQGIAIGKGGGEIYAATREGEICGYDARTLNPIFQSVASTQFLAHSSKTNNLQLSEYSPHLLTSGRDSAVRLWDLRVLSTPLQTYSSHTCKMFPIAAKFLYNERCIVTGSEDCAAYVYEKDSGRVLRKVDAGSHVTQTEPRSSSDLGFFVILYQNQRLGLMDVHGSDLQPERPSAEETYRERVKVAMQETLWELSNQIYQHLRVIGRFNMIGYGNLLEALHDTAATNAESQTLLQEIQTRYERKLTQRLPPITLPPLPADTVPAQKVCSARLPAPRVYKEKGEASVFPTYCPQFQ